MPSPGQAFREFEFTLPDDDLREDTEGFFLCLDIDETRPETRIDPRDRRRIQIENRYLLVPIMDNDGEVSFQVRDYK